VSALATKYETGLLEVEMNITEASKELSSMLEELTGSEFDLQAYKEFKNTLPCGLSEIMRVASLENMFPRKGETAPQVRFKGFTDKWEPRPLHDYLNVYVEKNVDDKYTKEDIFSVSNECGVVNQIKYQGKSLAGASLKGYKVTHKNSVIYTKSPLKNQPYGIIKTNKESSGIVSALYAVYTTKENVLADFIQVYFSSDNRLNDYLRPIVNKGAKNTLLVSDEGALSGMVVFPSDIKEQIYIANFFSCLHTLITAQEQKAYKLRCLKKSFLEKMFVTDK
jgi:type I restriction enzyme S subunit